MNILFIMYDQLRFDYLSCAGHPHLHTPNFDKVAAKGVRFTNAYVQSPVCGGSRMCFYTGRYASSHGAHWNGFPLRVGEQTLGDHLRRNGMDCWLIGKTHMKDEIDRLELKLAEAIMAERPDIERGIGAVRIISVVAPLAGLLGTVTGMIVTFQMITLYGTGDPKLMAGGISQALVTTVLGLLVAIPTTLLHSFTASSAKGIISVLEEQSTGILAERAEGNN